MSVRDMADVFIPEMAALDEPEDEYEPSIAGESVADVPVGDKEPALTALRAGGESFDDGLGSSGVQIQGWGRLTSLNSQGLWMNLSKEVYIEVKLPTIWTDEKAEIGRVREKRRVEERRSEKRKSQKKEAADAQKGRKVAKHCVFPMI